MPKKKPKRDDNTQYLMREAERKSRGPAHVVLLDYGRKAGIQNEAGEIVAVWPVSRPED
jgi:hypothetical protein